MKSNRLLIRVDKEYLPQIKDRYPFVYLERGRLEVDDSSVKWIDSEGRVIPLPISTIQSLLLGPGTSVTHEAIKVLAMVNCMVSWVGEDSLLYYAAGQTPTQNTRNLVKQLTLYSDPQKRLKVAKKMFSYRFPNTDIEKKSLKELMGMEGIRVKNLYYDLSVKYDVLWHGRNFKPGEFQISDLTNKCITACNTALYSLINACVHSMGLSPKIGFIHSGSPLPFVYDIADLYAFNAYRRVILPQICKMSRVRLTDMTDYSMLQDTGINQKLLDNSKAERAADVNRRSKLKDGEDPDMMTPDEIDAMIARERQKRMEARGGGNAQRRSGSTDHQPQRRRGGGNGGGSASNGTPSRRRH